MDIEDIQVKIVKEFSLFDDWMDKYKYIIKLGTKLEDLPLEDHIDDNLVKGCQSKVWLTANLVNDKLIFKSFVVIKKSINVLVYWQLSFIEFFSINKIFESKFRIIFYKNI